MKMTFILSIKFAGLARNILAALLAAPLCALVFPCGMALGRDYISVDQIGSPTPALKTGTARTRAPRNASPRAPSHSSRVYVGPNGQIYLFGTADLKRPNLPRWVDLVARNSQSPIFQAQKAFNKTTTWADLKAKLADKPLSEQMKIVNTFWNTWPYREDMANWGQEDYWAIPAEFLKKSGDCEDYAIVKYFTLKELGVDPAKMRIVVLRDTIRNLGHAVLAVYGDKDVHILDNLSNIVLSHRRLTNYSPRYSVNEYGRWTHFEGK